MCCHINGVDTISAAGADKLIKTERAEGPIDVGKLVGLYCAHTSTCVFVCVCVLQGVSYDVQPLLI